MEKIRLLVIGKNKFPLLDDYEKEYEKKIGRLIGFKIERIKGFNEKLPEKKLIIREGEEFIKRIEKGDWTIVLDEKGKEFDSVGFSKFLNNLTDTKRRINIISGNFAGLSTELKNKTDFKLSLSKMTFSNYIARVIILEQIYRALTISKGIRYHR
jgi:23S rRNA (pseudouridine1915-N3)-methyltransferase